MNLVKKTDGVNYIRDFLNLIQLKNVSMAQVKTTKEPCFYIRHDVDHDIDTALAIAKIEAKSNYRSTFFLLPPGSYGQHNYYGRIVNGRVVHDPLLIDKCRRLIDFGHDVGFHNDIVSLALIMRQIPKDLLASEVEFFEKHNIHLVGTAAHGNPLCQKLKYLNQEIFIEYVCNDRETGRIIKYNNHQVTLHTLRLADFRFQFEAYLLPKDSRISDTGGRWAGLIVGRRCDYHVESSSIIKKRLYKKFDCREFQSIISMLRPGANVRAMQVMTHPCHWRLA